MKRIVILEVYNQCLNKLIISITCRQILTHLIVKKLKVTKQHAFKLIKAQSLNVN